MNRISVLQIANENWQHQYEIPSNIAWTFVKPEDIMSLLPEDIGILKKDGKKPKAAKPYDVVLVDTVEHFEYITVLDSLIQVYRLFYHERCQITTKTLERFLLRKRAVQSTFEDPAQMLYLFSRGFSSKQSGTKLSVNHLAVNPSFSGQINYEGTNYLRLCGQYGEDYQTVATYQYNIFLSADAPLDLWPEFRNSEDCAIRYVIKGYPVGNSPMQEWIYDEESFDKPLVLDTSDSYYLSVSVQVKGQGIVKIGPFHHRQSHLGYGDLLIGGNRVVDKNREELIYYFHPGDLKPPLNIYFSGYRPAEGFEGYWMMNNLGAPFLLIGDPRSEGGAFYLCSEELEQKLVQVIHHCLDELGFTRDQLTLSGLSMGTFGALYYASKLEPHAVIVGKPLVNLGDIAENESTIRPGGFPTSLDLVLRTTGELSEEGIAQLNEHFWSAFKEADFSRTKFIVSYMYHDDYDGTAYPDMLEELGKRAYRVNIISKGLTGRHNDDTQGIVEWFFNQYKTLLVNSFERKFDS